MMSEPSQQQNQVFVLGVERSGSTWLANIFDASPAVTLFLEPFARAANVFRGFPDRLSYLDRAGSHLKARVRQDVANLTDYKYFGAETRDAPGWLRRLNWRAQQLARDVFETLSGGSGRERHSYFELNFSRSSNPGVFDFDKVARPTHTVIKELRMNFKVGMLREIFPEAQFVVIVRNPLSQVNSILRQFDRDTLVYLEQFLYSFFEAIEGQTRFEAFRPAIAELPDDDLFARTVAYWFANYTVLLEDLGRTDADFRIVRHETLSETPAATAREILAFAGLEWTEQIRDYVRASSRSESDEPGPTETTRNSRDYYRRDLAEIAASTRRQFRRHAEPFWPLLPDALADYRSWLNDHLETDRSSETSS